MTVQPEADPPPVEALRSAFLTIAYRLLPLLSQRNVCALLTACSWPTLDQYSRHAPGRTYVSGYALTLDSDFEIYRAGPPYRSAPRARLIARPQWRLSKFRIQTLTPAVEVA